MPETVEITANIRTRITFTNPTSNPMPVLSQPVFEPYSRAVHGGNWYATGESVNGDQLVYTNKYIYVSYTSGSGTRGYVAIAKFDSDGSDIVEFYGDVDYLQEW